MIQAFIQFMEQYGDLTPAGRDELLGKLKTTSVKKHDLLLQSGKVCNTLFFVNRGCLRLYYIAEGVEITVWLSFENNSAIELSSFLSESPSAYFIEAIEDSEIVSLDKSDLMQLYKSVPPLQEIMRRFWEDVILHLIRRMTALQKDSAEQRYLDLMNQPQYLQRIPQKYLASYIGVTPTSLSRIRKEIQQSP